MRRSYRLYVYSYVILPEHVHLLLSVTERQTLAGALQSHPTQAKTGLEWATHPTTRENRRSFDSRLNRCDAKACAAIRLLAQDDRLIEVVWVSATGCFRKYNSPAKYVVVKPIQKAMPKN